MQKLTEIAELTIKYVNTTHRHVFLTGKAGTGKTTLLRQIVNNTYKNTVVAAPTGIAAINAGGVTLHSLLQLPFGTFIPEAIPLTDSDSPVNTPQTIFRERKMNSIKRKLLQELELLIIDEVSMLRADLLDCIDLVLKSVRKRRSEPFGGVQLLFIGDLLQLPPVVKENEKNLLNRFYPSAYFFEARAVKDKPLIKIELKKIYRQSDRQFIGLLNRLRHSELLREDIKWLNEYYKPDFKHSSTDGYIFISTHNRKADRINQQQLRSINETEKTYTATISHNFPESMYPTVLNLKLKKGAQVMFIKNDPSGQGLFYNGKIGHVTTLNEDSITVKLDDGSQIDVQTYVWENKRYTLDQKTNDIKEKFLGSFEQLPVKLAWAVTIHKSQGLTFDKAVLDLAQTFAAGQLYVALSRLTSLDGLVLSSPFPQTLPEPDEMLQSFTKSYQQKHELTEELKTSRKEYIRQYATLAFNFGPLAKVMKDHYFSFSKAENRSEKQKYQPFALQLMNETGQWQSVGNKFIQQINTILQEEGYLQHLSERTTKAMKYFNPKLTAMGKNIASHLSALKAESHVKAYIKELESLKDQLVVCNKRVVKIALVLEFACQNKVLTKADLQQAQEYNALFIGKKQKKQKTPTVDITYNLYKQGKSVEEIVKERGLVTSTIEGHLSKCISDGRIALKELIDQQRIEVIENQLNKEYESLNEVKAALGDDYSYGQIRMVQAHQKAVASK